MRQSQRGGVLHQLSMISYPSLTTVAMPGFVCRLFALNKSSAILFGNMCLRYYMVEGIYIGDYEPLVEALFRSECHRIMISLFEVNHAKKRKRAWLRHVCLSMSIRIYLSTVLIYLPSTDCRIHFQWKNLTRIGTVTKVPKRNIILSPLTP